MKKIRLNEADLRYMIRKAINEVMAYEGDDSAEPVRDKYYFRDGWKKASGPGYKLSAEGAVGEGYDEYLADLTQFIQSVMNKPSRVPSIERNFKSWLAGREEAAKTGSRYMKSKIRQEQLIYNKDGKYPEYLSKKDMRVYDDWLKRIEEGPNWDKFDRDLYMKIRVDEPTGEKNPNSFWDFGGWARYANSKPNGETFPIDPDNIEDAAKKAWDAFNEYARRTPEVIGWHLWSWSTFEPTLKPILTPEVGKEISDESDKIAAYYGGPGGHWTGD